MKIVDFLISQKAEFVFASDFAEKLRILRMSPECGGKRKFSVARRDSENSRFPLLRYSCRSSLGARFQNRR